MSQYRQLTFGTRCLLLFCRKPGSPDLPMAGIHYDEGKELDRLEEVFPSFRQDVGGKRVIDFGSGFGYQSVALARAGARHVLGVEINEEGLVVGRQRAAFLGLGSKICFARKIPDGFQADVIISQNSFEHFLDSETILDQMSGALDAGGKIFITFAPPWYAPWGAHMAYFCRLPWVHLFFSEHTVMQTRSLFRPGAERKYRDVGLAQMSLSKFERTVRNSGLTVQSTRYDCVRGLNMLAKTLLRELFVNRVSCVLVKT